MTASRDLQKKNVLIIAHEDRIGLARLPRVLNRGGCRVHLIAGPDMLVGKTRFIDAVIASPDSLNDLIDISAKHLRDRRGRYEWVILADESVLRGLSKFAGERWLPSCFPVDPEGGAVALINSKDAFNHEAAEIGIAVPKFRLCTDPETAEQAAAAIGYPIILKDPAGSCGIGVRVVSDPKSLSEAFKPLADSPNSIIVQEFVTGQIGSTDVLYNQGKPICWISSYSIKTLPKGTGMSCVRELMEHTEIEPLLDNVGKLTGFHGLGGVDWIHVKESDALKFIEFNPRPTPGYHFGYRAGVDFSLAIQGMLDGNATVQKPQMPDRKSNKRIYMFPQDLYRSITDHSVISLFRWLPGLPGSRDMPVEDPNLLWTHFKRLSVRSWMEIQKSGQRLFHRLKRPFQLQRSSVSEDST